MLGIAHLVDSLGNDVETVTAVMHNDVADRNIMERAKQIMAEQDLDLFVVQFIGTDQTGHSRGVHYDEYVQKLKKLIGSFNNLLNGCMSKGKWTTRRSSFVPIMDKQMALVDTAI